MSGESEVEQVLLGLHPEDVASKLNCEVFYPNENQLTLDIDNDKSWNNFCVRYSELVKIFPKETFVHQELASKSGLPHRHVIITSSKTFTNFEKAAFQFALSSDPIRETLNLWRTLSGVENPIRLFRPKEEV